MRSTARSEGTESKPHELTIRAPERRDGYKRQRQEQGDELSGNEEDQRGLLDPVGRPSRLGWLGWRGQRARRGQ